MLFLYFKVFLALTLVHSWIPILATLIAFFFWSLNFESLVYKLCFNISHTSRYTNIVYIWMYLLYLVLAYKEILIPTVCFLFSYFCWCCRRYSWHVLKLRQYLRLRAFSIAIYGNFSSSYTLFFLTFFMWSLNFFHVITKLNKSDL